MPDVQGALAGDRSCVSYPLSDMAADSVGLLDVLRLDGAHILRASLGFARFYFVPLGIALGGGEA